MLPMWTCIRCLSPNPPLKHFYPRFPSPSCWNEFYYRHVLLWPSQISHADFWETPEKGNLDFMIFSQNYFFLWSFTKIIYFSDPLHDCNRLHMQRTPLCFYIITTNSAMRKPHFCAYQTTWQLSIHIAEIENILETLAPLCPPSPDIIPTLFSCNFDKICDEQTHFIWIYPGLSYHLAVKLKYTCLQLCTRQDTC